MAFVSGADALSGTRGVSPAFAEYTEQAATKSNFGRLRVESDGAFPDTVQMRSMGFAEGYLTAHAIYDYWYNMEWWLGTQMNGTQRRKLDSWLSRQAAWTRAQVAAHGGSGQDAFWDAQQLIMAQVDGVVEGYNARASQLDQAGADLKPLSTQAFMLLNAFGDIDDLIPMMELPFVTDGLLEDEGEGQSENEEARSEESEAGTGTQPKGRTRSKSKPKSSIKSNAKSDTMSKSKKEGRQLPGNWGQLSPGAVRARIAKQGRCSALIKVTSDLSDILIGHTTWWSYTALTRVYKHYISHLNNPAVLCQRASFPSYPGMVTSMDDFYVLGSRLVVTETSNDVYDLDLYRLSTNQAALSWQRTRAANMLAVNGTAWADVVSRYNSGTYNNQYMVVDLKQFTPGEALQPGLLTIVETLPGGHAVADTTQELERGYWPSYNIPYFADVYNQTGYADARAAMTARGAEYRGVSNALSYQASPRAIIFRRDAGGVAGLPDLKRLLRSNGWSQGDRVSGSPWDAICARGDLDPSDPDAYGCYDGKVTSYRLALAMSAEAVNGPAWAGDGNGQPAFSWSKWKHVSHRGMLDTYKTAFELQAP